MALSEVLEAAAWSMYVVPHHGNLYHRLKMASHMHRKEDKQVLWKKGAGSQAVEKELAVWPANE
eukprot:CAMPEP_0202924050 /NCGR_PEP_ID=MMETSP1392-20130828/78771_1 /ASSEMBLY_ACC=CAM_ASM_000868 /TAXON_ID=225041 /ORGANISM="Chlamydomonas chlamydogama, Strain SAG 11-48b" /LENGTH=63 /DNA_ID=CAMNT_0049617763 /DNA_START=92 /DNA_END=283 /DNA_ORIENTATION=-